jgi:hypothetical protein
MLQNVELSLVPRIVGGEEAMSEKKDPSGAPRNLSLLPTIGNAAPGGPSTPAETTTNSSGPPATGRSCLRLLIEIIKKRRNP